MKLKKISVSGLFDRFTHEIPLNLKDRITIIHGPNGFGKTMILRMINAFFNQSPIALANIPFRKLRLDFDNGSAVSVERKRQGKTKERDGKANIDMIYTERGNSPQHFTPKSNMRPEQLRFPVGAIEDLIPELDQVERQLWRHRGTGEMLSFTEVLDRYRDVLPLSESYRDPSTPDWLQAIRQTIPVRFINTERLYTAPPRRRPHSAYPPSYLPPEPAVRRYSEELGEKIKQTLTEYGTLSQSLDRTFPARLVAEPAQSDVTMIDLRKKLAEIEERRQQLIEAGLLIPEPEGRGVPAMPPLEKVDETRREVLAVYAQDAQRKLSVFDDVFTKIDLFKKVANARFLHKSVTVGQSGFGVVTSSGSQLDPVLLSSGEQHELVILYELLFRVRENSIILIDEPEISLHVAWQDEFLKDLGQLAELSQFHALVATHSPQIISDRWDLTVELQGPVE
jgi:predicted ATP-binding protein involved in virulence